MGCCVVALDVGDAWWQWRSLAHAKVMLGAAAGREGWMDGEQLCPSLCCGHLCSVYYPVLPLLPAPINICLLHCALPAY